MGDVLSGAQPPDWFMWIDCDALVTNRSISLEMVIRTHNISNMAHFIVAEEANGINTGIFFLRGSEPARDFVQRVAKSHWTSVWDQSMFLHRMAEDSGVLSSGDCKRDDFEWAPHISVVHQRAFNLYTEGSAKQWGAEAWTEGD